MHSYRAQCNKVNQKQTGHFIVEAVEVFGGFWLWESNRIEQNVENVIL